MNPWLHHPSHRRQSNKQELLDAQSRLESTTLMLREMVDLARKEGWLSAIVALRRMGMHGAADILEGSKGPEHPELPADDFKPEIRR
jgi:hypothetical protein